jgi:hypothetical protein
MKPATRGLTRIYCRIAIAPPFAGLRRFPEGRGFNQWTGDDSKALMKVSATLLKQYICLILDKFRSIFMQYKVICHLK